MTTSRPGIRPGPSHFVRTKPQKGKYRNNRIQYRVQVTFLTGPCPPNNNTRRNLVLSPRNESIISKENEQLKKKIDIGEQTITALHARLTEAIQESEEWRTKYSKMKEKTQAIIDEYSDCLKESSRLRIELERKNKINTREVVNQYLSFMSGIYNASLDLSTLEELKEHIRARIEYATMMSEICGIHINRHERGADLGDGRMDIDTVMTENPTMEDKVAKCRAFGCIFKDDCE